MHPVSLFRVSENACSWNVMYVSIQKNCYVLDHIRGTKPNIWYNFNLDTCSVHMAADKTIEIKSNSVILEV